MSALGPIVPKQFVFQRVIVLKEGPLRRATEPALQRDGPVATQLVHMAAAGFALQAAGAIGMHMREEFRIVVWPRALAHKLTCYAARALGYPTAPGAKECTRMR